MFIDAIIGPGGSRGKGHSRLARRDPSAPARDSRLDDSGQWVVLLYAQRLERFSPYLDVRTAASIRFSTSHQRSRNRGVA